MLDVVRYFPSGGILPMFSRPMLFAGVLVASIVVPYVVLNEELAATARGHWQRLTSFASFAADEVENPPHHEVTNRTATSASSPGATIEEAFRFDVSPEWVSRRWPRVSMVHGGLDHLGMRVAWVSGTRLDDVAGSLTYYFDQHHRLQRITFTGQAAEPRRLLAAVIPAYGLKSLPTTEAAHYVSGDPKQPTSEVIVKHLPVIAAEPAAPRVEVSLDLGRGDALSPSAAVERDAEGRLLPTHYRRW
jgi:hypothetical protein